jgi:murein DD-endopeptidase MepM/ murein hydrolase activator NlpD
MRSGPLRTGALAALLIAGSAGAASPLFDNPLLAGAWASPSTMGQGLFIDADPLGERLFVGWFTYAPQALDAPQAPSRHLWLTALLDVNGSAASGTLHLTQGGQFAAPPTAAQRADPIGTLMIHFSDCRNARVAYAFMLDGQSHHGSFDSAPLAVLVDDRIDCDAPVKLRWPHAAPAVDGDAYQALVDDTFVFNNFAQYQQAIAGRPELAYLHSGLDLLLPNGTPIHAVEAGRVRAIETAGGNNGFSVAVESNGSPGRGWQYVHVTPAREVGDAVEAGDLIGVVQFVGIEHLHLNRVELAPGSGSWLSRDLRLVNPAPWFDLRDDEPPVFRPELLLLQDASGSRFAPGTPTVVHGDVDIVAGIRDAGAYARSEVGVGPHVSDRHAIAWVDYEIEGQGRHLYQRAFDLLQLRLGGAGLGTVPLYMPLLHAEPVFRPARTLGYYILTHGDGSPWMEPAHSQRAWRTAARNDDGTAAFPNGLYTIRVRAGDVAGNVAGYEEQVEVRNATGP